MNELVEKLEEDLRKAMLESDSDMLNKLIHDDLFFILPDGNCANKEMDLHAHKNGIQALSKLECRKLQYKYTNDLILVSAIMELEGNYGGNNIDGLYSYSRVWQKNDVEKWQVISGHVSLLDSSQEM